jgi:hypothetical protein
MFTIACVLFSFLLRIVSLFDLTKFFPISQNCDPGYWCGCSSLLTEECLPTNDVNRSWIGHYTTTSKTTNQEIVLQGSIPYINEFANVNIDLKCPDGYYCPGRNDTGRCVDLCPPKRYCADPAQAVECPKEQYCPIASTVPIDCEGLQTCTEAGKRRFDYMAGMGVILLVLIVAVAHLFVVGSVIRRKERKAKQEKAAAQNESMIDAKMLVDSDADEPTEFSNANEKRRPTTVTSPDMTIDIEYNNMRCVQCCFRIIRFQQGF